MEIRSPEVMPTPESVVALERLGDEIAILSAHLDAATARLLDLIREFDARGGWANGFRSCADWLSWRVGLDKRAARERVRVARALGTLPLDVLHPRAAMRELAQVSRHQPNDASSPCEIDEGEIVAEPGMWPFR
jgi:hypothetical protein